jgi:enamine deaminase RidA (YjgF/YER057c/UK114 family)
MTPEEKISTLGIELPGAPKPLGAYVPFVRTGNLVYLSGMLPLKDGKLLMKGRLGETVSLEDAVLCARTAALNALGVMRSAVGSLDTIKQCVKISGFVASTPDFTDQPKVLNGASELMVEIFGEAGRHARVAVGVNILPMNSPVEADFIFEVGD